MKYAAAIIAAATLVVTPALAQQHQQSHPAPHPAAHAPSPAMHAPAMHASHPSMATHVSTHHTTHHVSHHMATHRAHHVVSHRHVVVHHVVHHVARVTTRPAFHRAPAAVIAKLRRNIVAVHRFHAGIYRAPPGYVYRRWVFGERLPGIYFAPAFWITDFLAFDLFPPPDGLIWVRFGPDALLIDRYSGEIIQVDYGVFF